MTQEEKNLLLKDLFTRLPYNVIVHRTYIWGGELKEDDGELEVFDMDSFLNNSVEKLNKQGCTIKPYLRSMSSMTEDDIKELSKIDEKRLIFSSRHLTYRLDGEIIDYLNRKMFDYRGLIEKGLALEAPEGMYK